MTRIISVIDVLQNVPPVANFTYIRKCLVGDVVNFTCESYDPDGTIVSWNWSFGDGNWSHQQNPRHSYSIPGTYFVSLSITDDDGDVGRAEMTISVARESLNNTPSVEIVTSSTRGIGPLNVSFTVLLNNIDEIMELQYFWDFGDGNTSHELNPFHVFVSPGNFTVSLTMMVDNNTIASDSIIIEVLSEINPLSDADSDKDGFSDAFETASGSDPYNPYSTPFDWDADGWNNSIETEVGTDPRDNISVPQDMDTDGIPDSLDPDRDGDGVANGDDAYPDDGGKWGGPKIVEKEGGAVWWIVGVVVGLVIIGTIIWALLVYNRRRKENTGSEMEEMGIDEFGRVKK